MCGGYLATNIASAMTQTWCGQHIMSFHVTRVYVKYTSEKDGEKRRESSESG